MSSNHETDRRCTEMIGMLHVPINTALAAPQPWRDALGVPSVSAADRHLVQEIDDARESPGPTCPSACVEAHVRKARSLDIYGFLEDRMLSEAKFLTRAGCSTLMLENVAAPYFTRDEQPLIIYLVMRALAEQLRAEHAKLVVGVQILAYSDDLAMDIACRSGLDFIRCESALFEGVRPEGRTPNHGNLAKLYMMRNSLMTELGKDGPVPQVYVDIQKKHTVFMPALASLNVWLDNILFQKLEGIVITGKATGQPVDEDDLRRSREAVEKARAESLAAVGVAWSPQLLVGSGASIDNIAICKRYADAVIVGSSLKKNGYWENPLDEERVKRFMEAWNA